MKKSIIRQKVSFNRYERYRTPTNRTKFTLIRNRVCDIQWSNKRDNFYDILTGFLNSPKRFFKDLNRLTGRVKMKGNFKIADNENKLNTDDFAVPNLSNGKFIWINKVFAAPIPTVPFTTEGLTNNEKTLFSIKLIPWKSQKMYQTLKTTMRPN